MTSVTCLVPPYAQSLSSLRLHSTLKGNGFAGTGFGTAPKLKPAWSLAEADAGSYRLGSSDVTASANPQQAVMIQEKALNEFLEARKAYMARPQTSSSLSSPNSASSSRRSRTEYDILSGALMPDDKNRQSRRSRHRANKTGEGSQTLSRCSSAPSGELRLPA
eukprot:CAMPEP_0197628528 /NCGR_PEP_ID=MMETSP1338-20131121/6800_1 /TAXON_ID=43686 ORGANISM="Pelagodinium beii, Strain RCC1491" /NCGR_SAMPLE_ID=MMETSP1338 /ASSEMBLY_ACC=CAM_ASM_000754 /LENGTH=162 /DNA_ID=CAMNT_0043199511 /DNA_START=46 /DNA_END=531 /DNA_ORIENTATION=+